MLPLPTRRLAALVVWLAAAPALAQDQRFAPEPSAGLTLPWTGLAGDADGAAVVSNPAQLPFLGGAHLDLSWTETLSEDVAGEGEGLGFYAATPVTLPFLPRLAFGVAAERLTPPRGVYSVEPGRPTRLSLATAWASGRSLAFGVTWHHFLADDGPSRGLDSFDLGASARLGAHLAAGLVVRDLFAPLAGDVKLYRRWELELATRPLGDDRLELAAGISLGERRGEVDPRLRASVKIGGGVRVFADGELRTLFATDVTDPMRDDERLYDARASLGVEVSFGRMGVGGFAGAATGARSGGRFVGGGGMLRWSNERLPSVLGPPERLVRLRLEGELGARDLARLLVYLKRLEEEPNVRGILVSLGNLDLGWAGLQELRQAFHRLRARGRKVFVYTVAATGRDYYVAAAADRIYLDAAGGLRLVGLSSTAIYVKQSLDRLGVLAQFEKIEEYKSAPEMFTRDSASEPAQAMRDELLDDMWEQFIGDVAKDRALSEAEVRRLVDDGPYTAGDAARTRLVDQVITPDQVDAILVKELGGRVALADGVHPARARTWAAPRVAVIFLEGDIIDGRSQNIPIVDQRMAGGQTLAASIAWARENPSIDAIVLRIDSPGGSALASELIAREVAATKGRKPIIVSMGDVAASGGYFAAAPGDLIYTERATVTGSIGIFTGKFDVSALAARLGLTWETEIRGRRADMESLYRPYTDEERALIKEKLRYFYGRFVTTVARGRAMGESEVDAVGRGHVWTGRQALANKLADREGGLVDALVEAKRRAGIPAGEPADLVFLPVEPKGLLGQLAGLVSDEQAGVVRVKTPAELALPPAPAPNALTPILSRLPASLLFGPQVPQARLPFVLLD
jgi:protease-4